MTDSELKALVVLLDDEDPEVYSHVLDKIKSQGTGIIPFLEEQWETQFNPVCQQRLEGIIHELQFNLVCKRLRVWNEGNQNNLLEVLWIIATYQFPDLDIDELKKQIEEIYIETWRQLKKNLSPFDQIKIINNVIFRNYKFRANSNNFHSPANSMINTVLESKKGNPISLCSVYLLIGQKLDLPLFGVNLPNLFMLIYKTDKLRFFINVFNKGLVFSKDDIENYIDHLKITPRESFFEPCDHRTIAIRYLRNLLISFEHLGEHHKTDEINQLLAAIGVRPIDSLF